MFEWYDFFLYGALAASIAAHFFSAADETTAFILALAAFAAGFLVRPFGALLFGRIGDIVGRKTTFLATMAIMGLATFLVGLLPGHSQLGIAAPVLLVSLRLLQGLAIGGEYGGAAIYVAEHAPAGRRGFATSWINATATLGLLLSLLVIMGVRASMSVESFQAWGWRIPFLVSIFLLGISLWIRVQLDESPVFQRMKREAATSKAPLSEAFGSWSNLRLVVIALLAGVAGATAVWYTGQFYTLFFLDRMLKVDGLTANALVAVALVVSAPSYVLFGWLSDRIGRKPVILTGLGLAILTIFPLFQSLTWAANPALARAQEASPVLVHTEPGGCSFQFDLLGRGGFDRSPCDISQSFLARAGIRYRRVSSAAGEPTEIHIGTQVVRPPDPRALSDGDLSLALSVFQEQARTALDQAGYPAAADPSEVDRPRVVAIIAFLVMLGAMTYAPMAALLVELFPARIRYTSLSLPYHLGSGWIGGLLPTTAFAIVAASGDIYAGLWYPVGFATLSALAALFLLPETHQRPIDG